MSTRKRRPTATDISSLTGAQALYVLNQLLKSRLISVRHVQVHLDNLKAKIDALEAQLRSLRDAAGDDRPAPARRSSTPRKAATRRAGKRRKQHLSPERLAELKRQGHYLALMRMVPKAQRAGYKEIFHAKGSQAAIDAMKETLGK